MTEKQLEFSVFCVENIAETVGKSGAEIYNLLKKSGLLENYVVPSYEALHTQSKKYIVDDIVGVIRERGGGYLSSTFFTAQKLLLILRLSLSDAMIWILGRGFTRQVYARKRKNGFSGF